MSFSIVGKAKESRCIYEAKHATGCHVPLYCAFFFSEHGIPEVICFKPLLLLPPVQSAITSPPSGHERGCRLRGGRDLRPALTRNRVGPGRLLSLTSTGQRIPGQFMHAKNHQGSSVRISSSPFCLSLRSAKSSPWSLRPHFRATPVALRGRGSSSPGRLAQFCRLQVNEQRSEG